LLTQGTNGGGRRQPAPNGDGTRRQQLSAGEGGSQSPEEWRESRGNAAEASVEAGAAQR